MKGVICSICPDAKIVDLSNNLQPHNIKEVAWGTVNFLQIFPKNTIFLCIVDLELVAEEML
jgi:S-adenosylmethionine hydrolase